MLHTTTTKRILSKLAICSSLLLIPHPSSSTALGEWIEKFVHNDPILHVPESELTCLARVIYHEARGEKTPGKYAVAQVALKRTEHPEFPDTVCGVIKAKNAFPWASTNSTPFRSQAYAEAKKMALEIMRFHVNGIEWGPEKTKNSLFFNTVPFTYKRLKYDGKIGSHLFYSLKD